MSSSTTQDLSESRAEALRALVSSLSNGDPQDPQDLPKAQVQALSEQLDHILGEGDIGPPPKRNERGELLNDDGLPIIEVTEPIADAEDDVSNAHSETFDEPEFVPLSARAPAEQERLRLMRDRIFDVLAAEEEEQNRRDAEREHRERNEALEQRKEDAKHQSERLKAAREMQKRMGKALLRNMADAREREEKERAAEARAAEALSARPKTLKPKKSVSFADVPNEDEERSRNPLPKDLGDVSIASLRGGRRRAFMNKADSPMKRDVFERIPGSSRVVPDNTPPLGDSDDDSDPEPPPDSDEDDHTGDDTGSDGEKGSEEHEHSEEFELGDDFDMSNAHHQREIALEYHRLRGTIGEDAKAAMTSHSHTEAEDEWDQPEVPLEATLASKPPKPPISRFKTARQFAYNAPGPRATTSVGASVLPAGYPIQKAIRTGKYVDGKLIGPEDDSASDGEDNGKMEDVLELLKRGDVTNIGPIASHTGGSNPVDPSVESQNPPQMKQDAKPSQFKIAHSHSSLPTSTASSESPTSNIVRSGSITPSSGAGRSSPKLTPSRSTSAQGEATTLEHPTVPFKKPPTVISHPTSQPSGLMKNDNSLMTNPSLSFPPNTIIHSPSFPQLAIIDSPSFPPTLDSELSKFTSAAVMSDEVRESRSSSAAGTNSSKPVGKVSRFKAARQ
ncbi:hypothetical protein BD410DRAFT_825103 [Rickenella mellea]|uniref:DUF3835 domain-containing protein n=1 Tax=Rickenella mellea TaxID=50990 RepID=A0A4Y7QJM3_9AGAM|nr:hypothetical protein BD410DRAFT_825103 [Rickenella mellea]